MDSDGDEFEDYDYSGDDHWYGLDPHWATDTQGDDSLHQYRVEFAQEMERRLDLRRQTWTWFDIKWSEDPRYYDAVEDWDGGDMLSITPPECNIDPRPILHDRRWTDLRIRDRGKELCTGELRPENFTSWSLGAIYQRMTDIDKLLLHIKDIWPVKMFELDDQPASARVVLKDAPDSHHVELARSLLIEHDMLRGIAHQHSRSFLRPLCLISLPPEVLGLVVQYLDNNTDEDPENFESKHSRNGSPNIRRLRLTCKTLNLVSSPRLLHRVTVRMTKSSLDRLKFVAERPHLRNGIERVRISLGYFCAAVAANPRNFTDYAVWMLRFALHRQDRQGLSIIGNIIHNDDALRRYNQLSGILSSWEKLLGTPRDGADGEQRWLALFRQQHALVEMYEAYKLSFEEYESVRQNFVHEVANALSKMPLLTRLEVSDHLWRSFADTTVWYDLQEALKCDENLMKGDLYRGLFTKPMQWDRLAQLSLVWDGPSLKTSPPVDILGQLFPLLGRLGVKLTKVDINITSPPKFEVLRPTQVEAQQDILKLLRNMWFLRFEIKPLADWMNYDREEADEYFEPRRWDARSTDALAGLDTFLDALLDTKSLRKIILDFESLMTENVSGDWYLPSIMKPRQWARPLELSMNSVCLDSTRLSRFIGDGPVHLRQFVNIHMARGTWTEALDVMHQKYDLGAYNAPKTSFTATDQFLDLHGAEVPHMDWTQQDNAFGAAFSNRPSAASQAYMYINHQREENPFRPFVQHVVV
ncbi:hypothetical protein CGCVW01_v013412 [Colletotrichum viniferum]|nr:hypothetical protein CGCVW01_v013412 [Colletotrichum viniferum]